MYNDIVEVNNIKALKQVFKLFTKTKLIKTHKAKLLKQETVKAIELEAYVLRYIIDYYKLIPDNIHKYTAKIKDNDIKVSIVFKDGGERVYKVKPIMLFKYMNTI